jgi:hypothetical protein
MLANCPSAGAVPDVNKSGQGMCVFVTVILYVSCIKGTHNRQGFAVCPTVLSLETENV